MPPCAQPQKNLKTSFLTLFAFRRKMSYLCNSEAGLSMGSPAFQVFFRLVSEYLRRISTPKSPYCNSKSKYSC